MKKLLLSAAIVAGLVLTGINTFANETGIKQTENRKNIKNITKLSGEVVDIEGDRFMLMDREGIKYQIIPAEPLEIAKIRVAEHVNVHMRDGRAITINRTDNTSKSKSLQGSSPEGTQNR